jgi:uncharacterized damage-inducible protein DinB
MRVQDLQRLYDYNYWANAKLLAVVARLTPDEFTQPVAGSYGSVRNTLVHVMSAEWGWLERCGGRARGPRLDPNDYPTADVLSTSWTKVEDYVREHLSTLSDQDLVRDVAFAFGTDAPRSVPLGFLMQHAANHGVHHRGQVALLLRTLGHVPGDFDLLYYDIERGGG